MTNSFKIKFLVRSRLAIPTKTIHSFCTRKVAQLNDARIRNALLRKLERQKSAPRAVLEELHVHNGQAIADVVTLHKEAHCYEIKGETDRIERILVQGIYYNRSFRRITLVTVDSRIERALKLAPRFWGLMVAYIDGEVVRFRHVRASKLNPNFDKHSAALTLWKSEMLELVAEPGAERKPRRQLAQMIADRNREFQLSIRISDQLLGRQESLRNSHVTPCR